MARIAGIDLPPNKRVEIGLTYIYGIGRARSGGILDKAKVDRTLKMKELTEELFGSGFRKLFRQFQHGGVAFSIG